MKWLLMVLGLIVMTVVLIIISTPFSFVMNLAERNIPALRYASVSGSVWNGEARDVRYGLQTIGDVDIKTRGARLLTGALSTDLRVTGGAVMARGAAEMGFGGTLSLKNVDIAGQTAGLAGLQPEIRELDGEFRLTLDALQVKNGACEAASGSAWTDLLTRMESRYQWQGPELSGPILCENGNIVLQMSGAGEAGETIRTELILSLQNAAGRFEAIIENPALQTAQAATYLGFLTEGEQLVYRYNVGPENGVG